MNNELLRLRGMLALDEQLAEVKELDIDADVGILREYADRHTPKAELDADRILAAATRLHASVKRLRELKGKIAEYKKDLGIQ